MKRYGATEYQKGIPVSVWDFGRVFFFWRRKKNEQLSSSNRITFFFAGKLKNVWLLCLYLVVQYPGQGEREARRPHYGDRAEGAGHLGLAGDAQRVADGEVPGEKVDHKMCKVVLL